MNPGQMLPVDLNAAGREINIDRESNQEGLTNIIWQKQLFEELEEQYAYANIMDCVNR